MNKPFLKLLPECIYKIISSIGRTEGHQFKSAKRHSKFGVFFISKDVNERGNVYEGSLKSKFLRLEKEE